MHLPDGIIPLNQALVYWVIMIIALLIFSYKMSKNQSEQRFVLIALLSVATVVATSISIPSPFGVPIHFFLIPLVVILLGPLNGIAVSFLSLVVQLFLGMGGLTTLGANVCAMGIALSIGTYIFYILVSKFSKTIGIFVATLMGIIFATLTQISILVISGSTSLEILIYSLLPFYLFVGLIESFATTLIVSTIERVKPDLITLDKF